MGSRCRICSAKLGTIIEEIGKFQLVRCNTCGVVSTARETTVAKEIYHKQYYGGGTLARFRVPLLQFVQSFFRWRRAKAIGRRLKNASRCRILDVGCGRGEMLMWLERYGFEVYGVEIDSNAVKASQSRVGDSRIFEGQLADAKFPDSFFQCVTLWHVLEHASDPLALLREITRITDPDGFVYVEVPNVGGWSAQTFRKNWLAFDIPNHLTHFSPTTLTFAAGIAGLQCTKRVFWSLEYSPFTLVQSLLNAVLGGRNLLFRRMSFELRYGETRATLVVAGLHLILGAITMIPAIALSAVLAMLRKGDTFGAYFVPTERS